MKLTEQVGYDASAAAKREADEPLGFNEDCAVQTMVKLAMTAMILRDNFMMTPWYF